MAKPKHELCDMKWIRRKTWPKSPNGSSPSLSVVDLFCGCGGLTLGVWEAARINEKSIKVKLAVDMSPAAIEVYKRNFHVPTTRAICEDLNLLFPGEPGDAAADDEKALAKKTGKVDILVAGPPCQGHSDLNNHTRRNDPRNLLYIRAVRAIEILRPRCALIENVAAVVHDNRNIVRKSIEFLESIGYCVQSLHLEASKLGLPQRRKRHILLVTREALPVPTHLANGNGVHLVPLSRFLQDLQDEPDLKSGIFDTPSGNSHANESRIRYLFDHDLFDLPDTERPPCHRDKPHSYRSMYGRLRWDQPAQTLTTGFGSMGQGRYVHPTRPRVITPHEAARIQGFPDFFDFSGVQKRKDLHEMIGNAVPPKVSAILTQTVLKGGHLK